MTIIAEAPTPARIVFGTDGWRARIADDFTFENVRRCADGVAAAVLAAGAASRGVVVAYDRRFASEHFAEAAAEVLLARDIPVFREIAGEHAFYFKGLAPEDLASAIERWLALYREGKHPRTEGMTWLTWEQSAERLKEIILEDVGSRPNRRADAEQAPADVAAAADRSFPGEQRP